MTLPNFIIVGAMKSGTSTLRDLLTLRHDVFLPPGEVHFFSDEDKYARGMAWYESLFSAATDAVAVGEKTPTYAYLPECAGRIHTALPEVKLVWLFRDPVARTYSHYWHSVKNGSERLPFRAAIATEADRVGKDPWRGYQRRSMYHEQVERYLKLFPRTQMHFLLLEHLLRDPLRETNSLLSFLGVERLAQAPPLPRSNQTFIPRNRTTQWAIRRVFRPRTRPYQFLSRFNRRATPGYPPLDPALRAQLRDTFVRPNQRLAELTGLDLAVWNAADRRNGGPGHDAGSRTAPASAVAMPAK